MFNIDNVEKEIINSFFEIFEIVLTKRNFDIQDNSLSILIDLEKNLKVNIYYSKRKENFKLNFTLIVNETRIWAIHYNNIQGWQENKLENPDLHFNINQMAINEIVIKVLEIVNQLNLNKE